MNPLVTILLPVKNAGDTLDECLRSVLVQTLTEFELLIVDDHSTDDSSEVAKRHAAADRRIRVLKNPAHGLVSALNYGLSQAGAEWVARMDADDVMLPQRLAQQYTQMTRYPDIVVLGTQVRLFPVATDGFNEYLRWQNQCLSATDIENDIYIEAPFAHPSVMFRRSEILDAGAYRDGDFPEDYELWLRLHALGARMEKLPEVLLHWRDTPGRLSRRDPRYRREAFDQLRAQYLAKDTRLTAGAKRFAIWGAGRKTRLRCARLLERGFNPCAWIDIDPRKIGNRLKNVPVVDPQWLLQNPVFVLGYVSNHGARDDIAQWLNSHGFTCGQDYLMVG